MLESLNYSFRNPET